MSQFIRACRRFVTDEYALASVEYAVLIALTAAAVVVDASPRFNESGNESKDVTGTLRRSSKN